MYNYHTFQNVLISESFFRKDLALFNKASVTFPNVCKCSNYDLAEAMKAFLPLLPTIIPEAETSYTEFLAVKEFTAY